jgi:integrase/recombinase XerC/integrase/recombinase XerD
MPKPAPKPPIPNKHLISREIIAFIIDRRSAKRSPATIRYYQTELDWFAAYLQQHKITLIEDITAEDIREYLIHQGGTRNANGVHCSFRAVKAWLNWWGIELDDDTWRNPIRKISPPKISSEPLPGVPMDHIHALLATCKRDRTGQRDRAILLTLLDTGLRSSEFLNLNYGDINLKSGAIQVHAGKGSKDRIVFSGNRSRREIIRYFRNRGELAANSPLWATQTGSRLTHAGLRDMFQRRSARAGIGTPQIHDFRRAFAIESLRNGCDLVTLMRLMGHTSPNVLRRYLHLVDGDLQKTHERTSPADNL